MFSHSARTFAAIAFFAATSLAAQKTINVPADQPTIQAGINAASTGDTVLVAPGTYYENVDFTAKAITLRGAKGAATTIIDGGGTGTAVYMGSAHTQPPAVLSGFTVQHGYPQLSHNNEYGAYNNGGAVVIEGNATVTNNIVQNNTSCGIDVHSGTITISGNHILNNVGAQTAGAYCRINAYGIFVGSEDQPYYGVYTDVLTIQDNVIESNNNGGIALTEFSGSIYTAFISGNTVRGNGLDQTFSGPGIGVGGISTVVINQNLIYGNGDAGVLFYPFDQGTLTNNTITGNGLRITTYQYTPGGTEVQTSVYGGSVLVNNVLVGASMNFPAIACTKQDPASNFGDLPTIFDHNIVFNTATQTGAIGCDPAAPMYGNLFVDPRFRNSAAGDFTLLPGSPAIDSGNNSAPYLLSVDFNGSLRIQNATGAAAPIVDMGVYEASGAVTPLATTLLLTPSTVNVNAGDSLTMTAVLSSLAGTPTGVLTLEEDGARIATQSSDNSGKVIFPVSSLTPGFHAFVAFFAAQNSFPATQSVKLYIHVDLYQPTITLTSSANPSLLGQSVTFTVKFSSPDGALAPVVLTDNNVTLATLTPDSMGAAKFTTSTLALGFHSISASYTGDALHKAASAVLYQQVSNGYPTATNLTSSPNPSTLNQSITFTAHVTPQTSTTGTPTGAIIFTDGAATLATQPLDTNGNATLSLSTLTAGTHTITATYSPTGSFAGSSATLSQKVNGLTPTATINALQAIPPTYGKPIGFFTNVTGVYGSPVPTGTVTFSVDSAVIGTSNLSATGLATLSTSNLTAGTHTATCLYNGDTTYNATPCNSITVIVTLAPSALTLSSSRPDAAPALAPITFSATLTSNNGSAAPLAGQSVTFLVDGVAAGSAATNSAGIASFLTANLPLGKHTVTAIFAGDANHTAATSSPLTETITANPTSIALIAAPNPGLQNQPITIAATVACLLPACGAQPYGSVSIAEGSTTLASLTISPTQTSPTVSFTVSTLAPGTHILTAAFTPADANFLPSLSTQLSVVILPQSYTLTTDPPSITIQTEHHRSLTVSLASIGGLTGAFKLSCGTLPEAASCTWAQTTVQLPPSGAVSTQLTLDTDVVLNFKSSLHNPDFQKGVDTPTFLAFLLPLAILTTKRRRLGSRLLLPLLFLAAGTLSLTSCSSKYPDHTPPGAYTIPLTATPLGITTTQPQTINFTLVVTQ